MKKILTAIGNEMINNNLREIEDIEVKEKDIFYKEGILEYLEKDSDIDIIILSETLLGEEANYYFSKIANMNIEIYLLTNKKHFMEEFENIKNIRLFDSENDIIMTFIHNDYFENREDSLSEEYKDNFQKRIISVIGNYGVGKTVFCSLLGKYIARNHKVLLINFDIFNDNLKYLFDLKKRIDFYNIDSLISKVYKNLYVLNGIKYVFNEMNKINTDKVKSLFKELKESFDYVLIDTSCETSLKFIKTIFPNCDYNIFLLEANTLEIKKAKELLEIYVMDFGLDLDKTGIFINKYNISSINPKIVAAIFNNVKILGKVNYTPKINTYINSFTKNNIKIDDIAKFQKYLKGTKI